MANSTLIKQLAHSNYVKFKRNPTKLNRELKKLLTFVKNGDIFEGQRYKLYKVINSYKPKK